MKSMLVVLFNQDFSRNIPALEQLYSQRFSEVRYLVPDHFSSLHNAYTASAFSPQIVLALDHSVNRLRRILGKINPNSLHGSDLSGVRNRIVRVVGHQFYFYHFLVQAANLLMNSDAQWLWIVGDDALINPCVDENSLWRLMEGVNARNTDAVICTPVIGSDKWIERIGGSVRRLSGSLRAAVGSESPWNGKFDIRAEQGAVENQAIAVGCADFIGISRITLHRLLPLLKRCFRKRIYVEVALPNAIMAASSRIHFASNYCWRRVSLEQEEKHLLTNFLSDQTSIFTHPIKLSKCSAVDVARIRSKYGA